MDIKIDAKRRIYLPHIMLEVLNNPKEIYICKEYGSNNIYLSTERPWYKLSSGINKTDFLLGMLAVGTQSRITLPTNILILIGFSIGEGLYMEALKCKYRRSKEEYYKVYIRKAT